MTRHRAGTATAPRPPSAARSSPGSLADLVLIAGAMVIAVTLTQWVATLEPRRVAELTVVNPTRYEVTVHARGADDHAWASVAIVGPSATAVVGPVLDEGPTWVFRVAAHGYDGGTFTRSADELARAGWRVEVPDSVATTLAAAGAEPAIDRR